MYTIPYYYFSFLSRTPALKNLKEVGETYNVVSREMKLINK